MIHNEPETSFRIEGQLFRQVGDKSGKHARAASPLRVVFPPSDRLLQQIHVQINTRDLSTGGILLAR
jgi:hypothetical protein